MLSSSNFGFLNALDAQLAQLGALAERYFRDDPPTAIFKLRQFAELLSKILAAHHGYISANESHLKRRSGVFRLNVSFPRKPPMFFTHCGRLATAQYTKPVAVIPTHCRR